MVWLVFVVVAVVASALVGGQNLDVPSSLSLTFLSFPSCRSLLASVTSPTPFVTVVVMAVLVACVKSVRRRLVRTKDEGKEVTVVDLGAVGRCCIVVCVARCPLPALASLEAEFPSVLYCARGRKRGLLW